MLARYGSRRGCTAAAGCWRAASIKRVSDRVVDPRSPSCSAGERCVAALVELGTTSIKFGQMLSLRPDVVGPDVADELTKLQAAVPANPPGSRWPSSNASSAGQRKISTARSRSSPSPPASITQVHKATLTDGTTVAVKVLHDGVERRVVDDLDLMQAGRQLPGTRRMPELAQLRPTLLIDEFSEMMHHAIDLSQELGQSPTIHGELAEEPDVVIPIRTPSCRGAGCSR